MTCHKARGLKDGDIAGKSDSYVEIGFSEEGRVRVYPLFVRQ